MSSRSPQALVVRAVILGVVAALFAVITPHAQAAPAPDPDKIKPKLAQQLESKGEAGFWVRFAQPDLTSASQVDGWDARGEAVYEALTSAAEADQRDTRALLDRQDVDYQAFFITNAIRVDSGDRELAEKLAADPAVVSLHPTSEYDLEEPAEGKDVKGVDAVEWGVANINADDVWEQFGTTGEGLVVGNIDTGVQYDHPALVNQYRGNNGDGTFTHDYNWFDAAGTCGDAPCDTNGHGTHTMGTMVGDDGGANQVGVAPGATWIAANGCCPTDAALISSGQWMLAPTDLDGENADPGHAPEHHQQLVGHPGAEQRPVHGGRAHGLEGGRDLRHLVQRQQRPGLQHQRVAREPDPELLRGRLRREQQHRVVLLPGHRAGR